MTTFAKLAGVLLFSGLALVRGAAPVAAGEQAVTRVAPLGGITLTVGSKRAIGYFTNDDKSCNLTLMLADAYTEGAIPSEPVRVNLAVRAGASARVETFESRALSFACSADATSMTIQPVERVAYNAVAR